MQYARRRFDMMRVLLALLLVAAAWPTPVRAQIALQSPFDTDYSFVDLGAVPSLPPNAGGLTFAPGDSSRLLIGGAANGPAAQVFSIGVTRDATSHLNGFVGTATLFANAGGIAGGGGIDGGLSFGPGGVLFYTSYPDNSIGEIK